MEFYSNPHEMARVLCQYIPCDRKVQREIAASMGVRLAISVIRSERVIVENRDKKFVKGFDRSVVWMDERHENNMDAANRNFVTAIMLARAA